jgi:hypothetical protein
LGCIPFTFILGLHCGAQQPLEGVLVVEVVWASWGVSVGGVVVAMMDRMPSCLGGKTTERWRGKSIGGGGLGGFAAAAAAVASK